MIYFIGLLGAASVTICREQFIKLNDSFNDIFQSVRCQGHISTVLMIRIEVLGVRATFQANLIVRTD